MPGDGVAAAANVIALRSRRARLTVRETGTGNAWQTCALRACGRSGDRYEDDAMNMVSEARTMALRLGSLLGRACGVADGAGEKCSGPGDFRLTSSDEAPAIMVAGRRSPVAGRRSPVAGRRSPVAGRYLCVRMAPPPKRIIFSA